MKSIKRYKNDSKNNSIFNKIQQIHANINKENTLNQMKDENYKSKKKNVTIMSDDQRLNFKNSLYNKIQV